MNLGNIELTAGMIALRLVLKKCIIEIINMTAPAIINA